MIRFRRVLVVFWWLGLLAVIAVMVQPISLTITRLAVAAGIFGLWASALFLTWKFRGLFWMLLLAGLLPGIFLLLPGREIDKRRLRDFYVGNLRKYEGARYVWGGENRRGIDCSGLVRRALINANLETGLMTLNPELVRAAISMIWRDRSALVLRDGADGLTKRVGEGSSINAVMQDFIVSPGTLAVTENGVHVLACVGKEDWIQAAPGEGKVVTLGVPSENSWYHVPVVLLEWTQLSDPRSPALIDMR